MDFKQMEAFLSVAKLKSFSKAANAIYLSQPTISSHIASLEKELNVQLFDRTSKEVNLTPAGKCFLNYAVDIINLKNNAVSSLCDFNDNVKGKLYLTASSTPCNTIITNLIRKFNNKFPNIQFMLKEQSSGAIIDDLLNYNYEIGLIGRNIDNDKINCYKLLDDELVVVSSPNLDLAEEISIEDIISYKFILRDKNSATRKTFEQALILNNISLNSLNIICEANNIDTLIQFVKNGLGVSILSKKLCSEYYGCETFNISRIKGIRLHRELNLIIHSKRTLTPIAKAFFNLCKEEYKF